MTYNILKEFKTFSGRTLFCEHQSASTKTKMNFSCFLPCPVEELESAIIWLSGLTCNEENFITKAGSQRYLDGTRTMIICPDTSPRGLELEGENESYDIGTGAGFYVNATKEPYAENYQMYDYILKDIQKLLKENFNCSKISIMGHSMGGHGALVLALRNPEVFTCVSAFAPIVNPSVTPWGRKAFETYLGKESNDWKDYDTCELLKAGKKHKSSILIDQGLADEFLSKELMPHNFVNVAIEVDQAFRLNEREGHDHSYYFISTFIDHHIHFHLEKLNSSCV